jgi:hypothetical protein
MRKLLFLGGVALFVFGGAALADDTDLTCSGGETYRAADGTLRRTARVCKETRTITVEPEKKVPDWVCGDAFDERGRKIGRTCHKDDE